MYNVTSLAVIPWSCCINVTSISSLDSARQTSCGDDVTNIHNQVSVRMTVTRNIILTMEFITTGGIVHIYALFFQPRHATLYTWQSLDQNTWIIITCQCTFKQYSTLRSYRTRPIDMSTVIVLLLPVKRIKLNCLIRR